MTFERYEGMGQDEKGIVRDNGPQIAWFKDPAGNIVSVLEGVPPAAADAARSFMARTEAGAGMATRSDSGC